MKSVYFVGIGGIGMSAIARHFNALGKTVAGYDRTSTPLTKEMEREHILITYDDEPSSIPYECRRPADTLVVYTPAIPADNAILKYFKDNNFRIEKRSVALGELTRHLDSLCVAGTHGKTTTSTLTAHILRNSHIGCSAFLGGISVNYDTNYWADPNSDVVVTEADEFDRSFLRLEPSMAVISAMDADHLDIYGTHAEVIKAYLQFAALVRSGGTLFVKQGLPISHQDVKNNVKVRTYSRTDPAAFYHAENVAPRNGRYEFDVVWPTGAVRGIRLGLPGLHNIENCVAAVAMAIEMGASEQEILNGCQSFRGNKRRFELKLELPNAVVIDDYAHHPKEISTTLASIKQLYPGRKLTVAFQPHLYSRTRDLASEFADALSMADRTWLLDIYPAREEPIAGVSSEMILSLMKDGVGRMSTKSSLAKDIISEDVDIVVVMGAGDIDRLVPEITDCVKSATSH